MKPDRFSQFLKGKISLFLNRETMSSKLYNKAFSLLNKYPHFEDYQNSNIVFITKGLPMGTRIPFGVEITDQLLTEIEAEIEIKETLIGLMPREILRANRILEIVAALKRYATAGRAADPLWIDELAELLQQH